MIDIETVKAHYATMLDGQLITTVKQDGLKLLPEAYAALKNEFQKRNLDGSYFEVIEQQKREIYEADIQKIKDSPEEERDQLLFNYILSEKEKLTTDSLILFGLSERGLSNEDAVAFLTGTAEKLTKKIDQVNTQIYIGGGLCVLGIFVTLLTYASARQHGGIVIITWGAILFGAARAIKAAQQQKRLKSLLQQIDLPAEYLQR